MKANNIERQVRAMMAQAEAASAGDTALAEVAGLVFVGDLYALREMLPHRDDGWGKRCYTCENHLPIL